MTKFIIFSFFLASLTITSSCKKTENADPLSFAEKMNGSHTWRGTSSNYSPYSSSSNSITFERSITVVNSKTIVFHYESSYYYWSVDTLDYFSTNKDTLIYIGATVDPAAQIGDRNEIRYNYKENTIEYHKFSNNRYAGEYIDVSTP